MEDSLDLNPYGIGLVLRKGVNLDTALNIHNMAHCSFSKSTSRVVMPSGNYAISFLGYGTYSDAYQAVHETSNTVSVIRVKTRIHTDYRFAEDIANAIKEFIINLILQKVSEGEPNGPYVPEAYEIAYDPERNVVVMRMERLHGTLSDLYQGSTPAQNEVLMPETVANLAYIMDFFSRKVALNHRDMKSNNVMYKHGANDEILVKLIDFDFTCLTWKGIFVQPTTFHLAVPKGFKQCYLASRDMTQYLFELYYSHRTKASIRFRDFLRTLLTFPLKGKACRLYDMSCVYKSHKIQKWTDIYEFLNEEGIVNPAGVPKAVYKAMLGFLGRPVPRTLTPVSSPPAADVAPAKRCLPEQILNPRTRRCVKRNGPVGRQIMRQTERRSPSPRPAAVAVAAADAQRRRVPTLRFKPCRADQIRNPQTRRCVKRGTEAPAGDRECPTADLIRNPVTRRCVKRDGAIGRRLLAERG